MSLFIHSWWDYLRWGRSYVANVLGLGIKIIDKTCGFLDIV